MKFNTIPPVPSAQSLLDVAFRRTKTAVDKRHTHSGYAVLRKEQKRVSTVADILIKRLTYAVKSFPYNHSLFYQELMRITIDVSQFESSLQSIHVLIDDINKLKAFTLQRISNTSDLDRLRRAFYGRISSLMRKSSKPLVYLDHVRHMMRRYPIIKELPTAAIVGFPNVGKTTLLSKLTTSNAKIAPYAFTTQNINCGYLSFGSKTVQLLDTPGTLARPEKMNIIEKQAYCAMKFCANILVYVFDPTETYPQEQQEKLFDIVSTFNKHMLIYLSKTDVAQEENILHFKQKHPNIITSIEELKSKLQLLL